MSKRTTFIFIFVLFTIVLLNSAAWAGVLSNVKAYYKKDRTGNYNVTITYTINRNHWKYSYHTIINGSMWMDCITSYDSRGYTYKKVVSSCSRSKLTDPAGQNKMTCWVARSKIPKKGYYMWVRLKVRIAGSDETYWTYAGKL